MTEIPKIDRSGQATKAAGYRHSGYNTFIGATDKFIADGRKYFSSTCLGSAWQLFERMKQKYPADRPLPTGLRKAFIALFQYHDIRSILDVGCGELPDFLTKVYSICREAKVGLSGINYEPIIKTEGLSDVDLVQGDAERLGEYFPGDTFDLIFCSGVLGKVQLYAKRAPAPQFGAERKIRNLREAKESAHNIVCRAFDQLSDNPCSAIFLQSMNSFLLLEKARLEEYGIKILYWNNHEMKHREKTNISGQIEYFTTSDGRALIREQKAWFDLWEQGANVAILAKH